MQSSGSSLDDDSGAYHTFQVFYGGGKAFRRYMEVTINVSCVNQAFHLLADYSSDDSSDDGLGIATTGVGTNRRSLMLIIGTSNAS